jgi:hypothetical protein
MSPYPDQLAAALSAIRARRIELDRFLARNPDVDGGEDRELQALDEREATLVAEFRQHVETATGLSYQQIEEVMQ